MVEEEVAAAATSPAPSDLKRKHQDLEPEAPEPNVSVNGMESDSIERAEEEGKEEEEAVPGGDDSVESEAKRPRLEEEEEEEKPDSLVTQNGFQEDKVKEPVEEDEGQAKESNTEKAPERVDDEQPSTDGQQAADIHPLHGENSQSESAQQPSSGVELEESFAEVPPQAKASSEEQPPASETQTMSRKMEVPNNKVGVLIGKAGDTIRFLQINSGAKIQIMRDADSDPHSTTRPVELIGSFESINKAEKLIKDVIAEADAGGSPSLVARGFSTAGAIEQVLIQVPNEKVGVIIGKGGETIKNLQTRSGARIQLTPQHLPEGDQSKERTVRVSGDKKQIEMARELIKEVMSQNVRPSSSGGYNQQAFRPRGPASQPQWGSRAPNAGRPTGYDYQQRGPYPSQVPQYPPHGYGNHPPQAGPRSSYGPGWEQRPPTMQGPPHQSSGYDYYGAQGQMVGAPASAPHSNPVPAHGPGPSPAHMGPPSQGNYNYGQPHGQPAQYPAQGYGHGYGETKYENHGPSHHAYGGHGGTQPQGSHPGFAPHDQYGKAPPSYGMPPHGPPAQTYGQPRVSQPGDVPYQGGPISSTQQPYGQNAPPPQQTYPYATSGPSPQTYAPYGPASATEGYNQQQPITGSAQMYPQQSAQPVPGYGQPGGQQQPGYAQAGSAGGYGSYPTMQPGYTEQPSQTNAGYGYQGAADTAYVGAPGSAYGAAPQTGQAGYAQPVPAQTGYDQTVPPSSGYGGVAGGMPAGYGKSVSPQPGYPQYDTTQMYGAPR